MMDSWQPFIPLSSKTYNKHGRIILAVIFLLAAILIGVGYDLNEKANFRCNPNKTIAADLVAKNFVETNCYIEYAKKHHRSVPVSRFVVINFGLILAMSVAYVGIVNSKVEKFESKTVQNMNESTQESWQEESNREARIFVFPLYILHLFLGRVLPIILFIFLIHPANFPQQFKCSWPPHKTIANVATTDQSLPSKTTIVECVNPLGEKFETLATSVLGADCVIGVLAILEIAYLIYQFYKDADFATDVEFCCMYILEKRNLTIRQILKRIRKTIRENEHFNYVNLAFNRNGQPLGDLHFRFLVHEEIASRWLQRHEIYNLYLKQGPTSVKNRLVYLFPTDNVQIVIGHNASNTSNTGNSPNTTSNTAATHTATEDTNNTEILQICDKILITGRAGIGKTTVAKAMLYRWAKCRLLEDKVVIFLTFRSFRKNKATTLKKLLRQGKRTPSGSNFEELYKFILVNPKKTVLIFDGLEDIELDCDSCLKELDEDTMNDYEEAMSMFTIYLKLLKDKLLPGATIITTSRHDKAQNICNIFKIQFHTRLELLGFSKHEIKDYVKTFCQSETTDVSAKIWKTIKNNPEFLSLCYIPATCDIVCLTLKECFDKSKTENDIAKFVPKTVTELYQRAIRVIIWKQLYFGKFKGIFGNGSYLIGYLPQSPENFMKILKRLAKSKLESMETSFQLEAEDISQQIISCGLLTPLPEEYYTFLHVTMQEFLAACHIVDEMKDICDVRLFLSSLKSYLEKPSWHLVVQFVVGLLGEKIKKKRIDVPKESICRSFLQWVRPLTASNEDKNAKRAALLVIKCLHEMQDEDIVKLCASELDGRGNNVCYLNGLNIASIDCMALFQFLIYVKNLTKLNISNNQISDLGCFGLAKLLNDKVSLTILNLTRINLSDKGIKILCDNLDAKNRRLTHMILEINQITAEGVKSLCEAIINKKLNLTDLNLRSNEILVEGAKALCTVLSHDNCNITKLNLCGSKIGNEGVAVLCEALQHKNCKLLDLCLSTSNISYDGVRSLCDILQVGKCRLTSLGLQRNNLTAYDVEPLRDVLRSKNCTLTKLDVSGNDLTDLGVECLYHGLVEENICRLVNLSLANNKIKDRGVKIICDALKNENCKLTVLDLSCNEIGKMGVKHLCDALKNTNCKITNLWLMSNNMTSQDINSMRGSFNFAAKQTQNRGHLAMMY